MGEMYSAIKKADSSCIFGISPRGIVSQDYDLVYADVAYWASHAGYCDYLAPQVYYGFEHASAPYDEIVEEWSEMTTAPGVSLRIGLAAYKVGAVDTYAGSGKKRMDTEYRYHRAADRPLPQYDNIEGIILFRYDQIFTSPNSAMTVEKKNFMALLQ